MEHNMTMTFQLEGQEYIELLKLLKFMNLVESGAEAKLIIDDGVGVKQRL